MNKILARVSGKIETNQAGCFVGDKKVDCPQQGLPTTSSQTAKTEFGSSWQTDILPPTDILPDNFMKDFRNDSLFYSILGLVLLIFITLLVSRLKIFGKTLVEYLKPIWYYIVLSLAAVAFQYLYLVENYNPQLARISQAVWALAVALSVYTLIKKHDFKFRQIVFLGILYSLIIHGTKVSIRYFFYNSSIFYVLDRFIYGSLLVMAIVVILGAVFSILKNKRVKFKI